jgi:hypothetical protein
MDVSSPVEGVIRVSLIEGLLGVGVRGCGLRREQQEDGGGREVM